MGGSKGFSRSNKMGRKRQRQLNKHECKIMDIPLQSLVAGEYLHINL